MFCCLPPPVSELEWKERAWKSEKKKKKKKKKIAIHFRTLTLERFTYSSCAVLRDTKVLEVGRSGPFAVRALHGSSSTSHAVLVYMLGFRVQGLGSWFQKEQEMVYLFGPHASEAVDPQKKHHFMSCRTCLSTSPHIKPQLAPPMKVPPNTSAR